MDCWSEIGVVTIGCECLNLVPIALVQGMNYWSDMRSGNHREWVTKSSTNCSCARMDCWSEMRSGNNRLWVYKSSINCFCASNGWISDPRCGVGTIGSECLNLVRIALVQGMDCWSEMRSGNNRKWVSKSSTNCSYARNGLLIGDAEWEQQGVCLNLLPIALVQVWIADWICGVGTISLWVSNSSTNCSYARNGLLIGDAEWEQ